MDPSNSRNIQAADPQNPPLSSNGTPQGAPSSHTNNSILKTQLRNIPSEPIPTKNEASQNTDLFSKFTLFPRLPLELRLMIWRYSIPRKIRHQFQNISHPSVSAASLKVYQAARSRYPDENLRGKLSLISHTLDIPCFNLLDMAIADKVKKAKKEFKEWMNTTDTIALSINMRDYIDMLAVKISRQRVIGESTKSVLQILPFNIKRLLILLDYTDGDKPLYLNDVNYAGEPQLQYIQDEVSNMISAGALVSRFRVLYKTIKARTA